MLARQGLNSGLFAIGRCRSSSSYNCHFCCHSIQETKARIKEQAEERRKNNSLVCVAWEISFLSSKSTLILVDGLADAEILIPIYGAGWKYKHFTPLRVVFAIPSAPLPLLFALPALVFCLDCGDVWVIVTTNTAQRLRSSLGHTHTRTHTHTHAHTHTQVRLVYLTSWQYRIVLDVGSSLGDSICTSAMTRKMA